ncbi:MAG: T9SS type A sorting domain-containing protein [Flavobacteriales bacterium]|nr:T9SS type A sorting domain-containing protein [Flavobacteriales bacterium]
MKKNYVLAAFLSLFLTTFSFACPVWKIGYLRVVDENFNPIVHARVWQFYGKDSFPKSKNMFEYRKGVSDTNRFIFYSSMGRFIHSEIQDRALRIQAEGYGDVVIREISFDRGKDRQLPVLVVVMYPPKFIKSNKQLTLLKEYRFTEMVNVEDSVVLSMKNYVKDLKLDEGAPEVLNTAVLSLKTYPNPVVEELTVLINQEVADPYVLELYDRNGKFIRREYLRFAKNTFDMRWEVKGEYVVRVLNPKGDPVYSGRILKL